MVNSKAEANLHLNHHDASVFLLEPLSLHTPGNLLSILKQMIFFSKKKRIHTIQLSTTIVLMLLKN